MTICAAAFSHPDRTLVAVSDRMFTRGGHVAENAAHKQWAIHSDWFTMFSGDIGAASMIVRDAEAHLDPSCPHSPPMAAQAVQMAWIRARTSLAEASVLSAYGITMAEFIKSGAEWFQRADYHALNEAIRASKPECDFLVYGFDEVGYPHVLSVEDGIVSDFDSFGYWAIGSGADHALGSLALRQHSFRNDSATTLYHLLEARFAAEADKDVGRDETLALVVQYRQFPALMLEGTLTATLRKQFRAQREQYPQGALEMLRERMSQPVRPANQ